MDGTLAQLGNFCLKVVHLVLGEPIGDLAERVGDGVLDEERDVPVGAVNHHELVILVLVIHCRDRRDLWRSCSVHLGSTPVGELGEHGMAKAIAGMMVGILGLPLGAGAVLVGGELVFWARRWCLLVGRGHAVHDWRIILDAHRIRQVSQVRDGAGRAETTHAKPISNA